MPREGRESPRESIYCIYILYSDVNAFSKRKKASANSPQKKKLSHEGVPHSKLMLLFLPLLEASGGCSAVPCYAPADAFFDPNGVLGSIRRERSAKANLRETVPAKANMSRNHRNRGLQKQIHSTPFIHESFQHCSLVQINMFAWHVSALKHTPVPAHIRTHAYAYAHTRMAHIRMQMHASTRSYTHAHIRAHTKSHTPSFLHPSIHPSLPSSLAPSLHSAMNSIMFVHS